MRILEADEHKRRLRLYRQGLNDSEIARKLGLTAAGVRRWRQRHGLKPNAVRGSQLKGSVRMEQALAPEECEKMRLFLRQVVYYGRKYESRVVNPLMHIWRFHSVQNVEKGGIGND